LRTLVDRGEDPFVLEEARNRQAIDDAPSNGVARHPAGVVEPELHRFRKSYADTLADEGLPVPTIMNRLGHCSLDVTLAYLRGREAEGEQEQNFANQSALAVYA
jgi:integrase